MRFVTQDILYWLQLQIYVSNFAHAGSTIASAVVLILVLKSSLNRIILKRIPAAVKCAELGYIQ